METGIPAERPVADAPTEAKAAGLAGSASTPGIPRVPFGVNEVRLNARQWLVTLTILVLIIALTPWIWERVERFDVGPDYRIPYDLSKDYWLYARRVRQAVDRDKIVVLGDSVVWGEYVAPDGTLSHFLDKANGATNQFINGGVNGLFPLAQEGLVTWYGKALRHQKIILQCNLLWMTSPKADLSSDKEEQFNHSRLVPQFFPRIPCYRADANERLSAVIQREVPFLQWVGHLQNAYYGQKSILSWTLEDDGSSPPRYPNVYRNPLKQITLEVPSSPKDDPQRGPKSPRHKPWSTDNQGTTAFEWVPLDSSVQWHAFQRIVGLLRKRGNDVLVLVGPFNEYMMTPENRVAYRRNRDGVAKWLRENGVPAVIPESLPSHLYADASHPLTEGYELLAQRIFADETFRVWLRRPRQ